MRFTQSSTIQSGLDQLGIQSYADFLWYFPRQYVDFSLTHDVLLIDKQKVVLLGEVKSAPRLSRMGKLTLLSFQFLSKEGVYVTVSAFNRPYLTSSVHVGETYTVSGTYDVKRKTINLSTLVKGTLEGTRQFKALYRLPGEIENFHFVRMVKKAFTEIDPSFYVETLPEDVRLRHHLIDVKKAFFSRHFPLSQDDIDQSILYFKYREAYEFNQKVQQLKIQSFLEKKGIYPHVDKERVEAYIRSIPYVLTDDQHHVVSEILEDFKKPFYMNRLLQGDVGSGKTLVAAITLFANATRGYQGALMVPTDALAKQHYENVKLLFKHTPYQVGLLVGSMDTSQKKEVKQSLKQGSIHLVIGTHALFSNDVQYKQLGCVVIDEQHRFGTNQREALEKKGPFVDVLSMSATPIPRSLAMTLYADMDVSTITTFPFAKRDVKTKIVEEESSLIDYMIQEALLNDKRVYLIAPYIDQQEEGFHDVMSLSKDFLKKYPGKVGLLHGKLSQEEKEVALIRFKEGVTPILVSTTVVEVGIDVKPATLMIIYDAQLFGLASLHQLRGRIGRDGHRALCLLVVPSLAIEGMPRLQVLEQSMDGFFISEQDLLLRGPGEVIGVKQSGMPHFHDLNIVKDQKILESMKHYLLERQLSHK